jgi:hypothetical protein
VQGGVERAMLDLQQVIRSAFDGVSDRMAVGGTDRERLQDQQVDQ